MCLYVLFIYMFYLFYKNFCSQPVEALDKWCISLIDDMKQGWELHILNSFLLKLCLCL